MGGPDRSESGQRRGDGHPAASTPFSAMASGPDSDVSIMSLATGLASPRFWGAGVLYSEHAYDDSASSLAVRIARPT